MYQNLVTGYGSLEHMILLCFPFMLVKELLAVPPLQRSDRNNEPTLQQGLHGFDSLLGSLLLILV